MAKRKSTKILNPTKEELLSYEREHLGVNITNIMNDSDLKVEKNGFKRIRDIKDLILSSTSVNNMFVVGKVTLIESKRSAAGNYFYWITIIDNRDSYKLYCNSDTFIKYSNNIIISKISLFNVNIKNDFVSFNKAIFIERVPFKRGYIFVIHTPFNINDNIVVEYIKGMKNRGINDGTVEVFKNTQSTGLFIDPTYSIIKSIDKLFNVKCTIELYEDFIWGESNKLIKQMEENGF